MTTTIRIDRKLAMSSTIQVKIDLDAMEAPDGLADADSVPIALEHSEADHRHAAGDLAAKHGLSLERATMLVDRYGLARHALEGAAQALLERKA